MEDVEKIEAIAYGMKLAYSSLVETLDRVKSNYGVEYFSVDDIKMTIEKIVNKSAEILEQENKD